VRRIDTGAIRRIAGRTAGPAGSSSGSSSGSMYYELSYY